MRGDAGFVVGSSGGGGGGGRKVMLSHCCVIQLARVESKGCNIKLIKEPNVIMILCFRSLSVHKQRSDGTDVPCVHSTHAVFFK